MIKKEIHTVNVKNNGTIQNLDNDVVIECNAMVDKTGAVPMVIGKIPPQLYLDWLIT